jgi:hypothetical protein
MVEDRLWSIVIHGVKMVAIITGNLEEEEVRAAHQFMSLFLVIHGTTLALPRILRGMVAQVLRAISRVLPFITAQVAVAVSMVVKSDRILGRL